MLTTKEFNFHSCHKTATGIQLKRHLRSFHCSFYSHIIAAKLFIFSILFIPYFMCIMADKWQTWEEETKMRKIKNIFSATNSIAPLICFWVTQLKWGQKREMSSQEFSCILSFRCHCWGKLRKFLYFCSSKLFYFFLLFHFTSYPHHWK